MTLPGKLEFGNPEHIKAVKDAENKVIAKKYLEDHWLDILKFHWEGHDYYCTDCGSHVPHWDEPDFELGEAWATEFQLRLICRGRNCREEKEVTIVMTLPTAPAVKGEQFEIP